MEYELDKFLKAMNRSDMFASPNAGEYFASFYLMAYEVLFALTGHLIGLRPWPSVTENR